MSSIASIFGTHTQTDKAKWNAWWFYSERSHLWIDHHLEMWGSLHCCKAVQAVTRRCVMTDPWIHCDPLVFLSVPGEMWFTYLWLNQNAVLVITAHFVDLYKARKVESLINLKASTLVRCEPAQIRLIGFQEFMKSPVGLCAPIGQEGNQLFSP